MIYWISFLGKTLFFSLSENQFCLSNSLKKTRAPKRPTFLTSWITQSKTKGNVFCLFVRMLFISEYGSIDFWIYVCVCKKHTPGSTFFLRKWKISGYWTTFVLLCVCMSTTTSGKKWFHCNFNFSFVICHIRKQKPKQVRV